MDMNAMIDGMAKAIASDEALEVFCRAEYGAGVTVFLNFDSRNPPGAGDCPCACIYPSAKKYGSGPYHDAVEIVCMVHDETVSTVPGYENLRFFSGVTNVEEMRKLVLAAISVVLENTDNSRVASVDVDYDTISWFPFIAASQVVAVETPYTIGSGNPITRE